MFDYVIEIIGSGDLFGEKYFRFNGNDIDGGLYPGTENPILRFYENKVVKIMVGNSQPSTSINVASCTNADCVSVNETYVFTSFIEEGKSEYWTTPASPTPQTYAYFGSNFSNYLIGKILILPLPDPPSPSPPSFPPAPPSAPPPPYEIQFLAVVNGNTDYIVGGYHKYGDVIGMDPAFFFQTGSEVAFIKAFPGHPYNIRDCGSINSSDSDGDGIFDALDSDFHDACTSAGADVFHTGQDGTQTYTFTTPNKWYQYYCTSHEDMFGNIVIQP